MKNGKRELTFAIEPIRAALAHSETAKERAPCWGQEQPVEPGLLFVGDDGVYLMSNGKPRAPGEHVVYADQCNPKVMPFDQWWDAKRTIYGGDDGADFVPASVVREVMDKFPKARKLLVVIEGDSLCFGVIL